ncbi:hypothetical protein AURDEDRAFT_166028, partial [Auricularia subglabra TFB-10046 SS5]
MVWERPDIDSCLVAPSIEATFSSYPLLRPPPSEYRNAEALATIASRPDLFAIVTPINAARLRDLLRDHPNRAFCESVIVGLTEGFWPLADTFRDDAPITTDLSDPKPWPEDKLRFFADTRDEEIADRRWSADFGPKLLPGMTSSPVFAVPKPHSDKFRLVVDHSAGNPSLNSFIDRSNVSTRLDTLHDLVRFLRAQRARGCGQLSMFKSDVSKAYRRLPAHPLWQIKQIVSVGGARHVDRCCNFGTKSSGDFWFSLMALVLYVAVFVRGIDSLLVYVDDTFSFDDFANLVLYEPYNILLPLKQCRLLTLWDDIGLPHSMEKQVYGSPLRIIGLDIDPNAMTIAYPEDQRVDLIRKIRHFISARSCSDPMTRPLREWQSLLGQASWSLYAYPLLRPGLSAAWAKCANKSGKSWPVILNSTVIRDLTWFADSLERAAPLQLLDADHWQPEEADITLICDASLSGLGFWEPLDRRGFACEHPHHNIIFNESLCVLSALRFATAHTNRPRKIALYTDSQNAADMFNSLKAKELYNDILFAACDLAITSGTSFRAFHIPGLENPVADALSRGEFERARALVPGLSIESFTPPVVLRPQPDVVELRNARNTALGFSLEAGSRRNYNSHLKSYQSFCKRHDLPVEPTPDTLSLYAAYESHYISATSVRTYLSGICHSLEPFYPNVRASRCSDLVRNTVAGCVKMSAHTVNRKSPLAASDLARMLAKYGASDVFDDKLFLAILFVGFNALLRLGELVWPDSNALADYRKCIPFSSLAWRDALAPAGDGLEQFSFTLPGHKGNRFFEGDTVVVTDRPDAANALP